MISRLGTIFNTWKQTAFLVMNYINKNYGAHTVLLLALVNIVLISIPNVQMMVLLHAVVGLMLKERQPC